MSTFASDPNWFSVAGLVLALAGAAILAWGLFLSKDGAIKLGSSYFSDGSKQDQLNLPPVADRLRQSRNAKVGLALITIGTLSQIVGALRG